MENTYKEICNKCGKTIIRDYSSTMSLEEIHFCSDSLDNIRNTGSDEK